MCDGAACREMSLDEWARRLPQAHRVNVELSALRASVARLQSRWDTLKAKPLWVSDVEDDPTLAYPLAQVMTEMEAQR